MFNRKYQDLYNAQLYELLCSNICYCLDNKKFLHFDSMCSKHLINWRANNHASMLFRASFCVLILVILSLQPLCAQNQLLSEEELASLEAQGAISVITKPDYRPAVRLALVMIGFLIVSAFWIFRLRRVNSALDESQRSKAVLLSNLPGIAYRCRYDEQWTMEFISDGCLALTGYASKDLLLNRKLSYNDLIFEEYRESIRKVWKKAFDQNTAAKLEYQIHTADGSMKWVYESGIFVFDDRDKHFYIEGLIIDISDRKRAEDELYRITIHDHLTGLYNRRYMFKRLHELLQERSRGGRDFSLTIIDLDLFKEVNDTWGHLAGDYVLREFSQLLQKNCRTYDLAGRFGGEEFIIVGVNSDAENTHSILERLYQRIMDYPFNYQGASIVPAFSAGIAVSTELQVGQGLEDLVRLADQRLYTAKVDGRGRIVGPEQTSTL